MYILKYRTVPPVHMTLSLSESDSHRNGAYKDDLTVDSQFSIVITELFYSITTMKGGT